MKVKGKKELEAIASSIWLTCEGLKLCEIAYVISELTKKVSLEMISWDQEHDRKP